VYIMLRAMASTWAVDRTAEGAAVYGELDHACAAPFEEELAAAVMEGSGKSFLIDLSAVTFMDSSGLRALRTGLDLGGAKNLIVQPSRQVFKLLQLTGLAGDLLPNVEVRSPRYFP
jgi:anti-anti-sigma factor